MQTAFSKLSESTKVFYVGIQIIGPVQECVCGRNGHDGVVGVIRTFGKQRGGWVLVVREFECRTCDVSDYGADHRLRCWRK
ncbi:MAG: hypothetical protein JWR26_2277 [Pedosphaera sp.]|nr:hypothetical protein [Pedosphaera sp.]